MIRSGHRRLARLFNLCYRYIDDFIVFNNKKFLDYLKEIYPSQLTVEKANKSDHLADYLDLTFIIDNSSIYRTRSTPMLIIFDQPLFELLTLLLCGQSLLFKVDTYCSRTEAYCYGVKTYYSQQ